MPARDDAKGFSSSTLLTEPAENTNVRFQHVCAMVPVGIFFTDTRGECLYVNPKWQEITGLSLETSLGQRWASAIHPDERQSVFSDWSGSIEEGKPFEREIRWLRPDGEVRCTISRATAITNSAGQCTGYVGTCEDITERKIRELEVLKLRDDLHDAIESIEAGVVMFDAQERLVVCNSAYRALYGIPDSVARPGATFAELLSEIFASDPEKFRVALGGRSFDEILVERLAAFRSLECGVLQNIAGRWIRADERRTKNGGTVGLRTDVTALVLNKETLRKSVQVAESANLEKSRFLATMSHEIRTPLNGIIGMTQLLIKTDLSREQREFAETIRVCGEGLMTLINDILDFSKIEAGKLQLEQVPFRVDRMVAEALPMFSATAEQKALELDVRFLNPIPVLLGDVTRIRQVLLNLLSNAVKFTENGFVRVVVSSTMADDGKHLLRVRVQDSGIGIAPEHLEKIGQEFAQGDASTTRRFGGSGLGLSICRSLLSMMGGELHVTSKAGVGTTFEVTIMLARSELVIPTITQECSVFEPGDSPFRAKRILVAEDNSVNSRLIALMLKRHSESALFVKNGQEAVDSFKLERFDCVLMDCQMPLLDGLEATRQIRAWEASQNRRPTPIIALTANALPGDKQACLDAGMNDYLTKPVRDDDLGTVLKKYSPSAGRKPNEFTV